MWYGNGYHHAWGPGIEGALLVGVGGLILAIIALWSLAWKGLALWKAAHKGSKVWFVVLLVVNTFGILDILYIYIFSKKKLSTAMHDGGQEHHHQKKAE